MVLDPCHTDLQDTPLENQDLILFAGESYAKNAEGKYQAEYAVTTQQELLVKESFPQFKPA